MNRFRVLSSNDGFINTTNASSFLSYFINPSEDHGLSSLFLQEILTEFISIDSNDLKEIPFEKRITDLSNYDKVPSLKLKKTTNGHF